MADKTLFDGVELELNDLYSRKARLSGYAQYGFGPVYDETTSDELKAGMEKIRQNNREKEMLAWFCDDCSRFLSYCDPNAAKTKTKRYYNGAKNKKQASESFLNKVKILIDDHEFGNYYAASLKNMVAFAELTLKEGR